MKPNVQRSIPRKPIIRATEARQHQVNLRCPNEDCTYFAKTPRGMLRLGRLKCPVHKVALQTRSERGEQRGRRAG